MTVKIEKDVRQTYWVRVFSDQKARLQEVLKSTAVRRKYGNGGNMIVALVEAEYAKLTGGAR